MLGGGHVELDFSAIPKLHGPDNFWHWRILLRAYLESADLWKDDHPRESPQAKFIILATLPFDKCQPAYDQLSPKEIFKTLEELFRPY